MKTPEQLRAWRRNRAAKAKYETLRAEYKTQNIASIEAQIKQINEFDMPLQMAMMHLFFIPDVTESCRLANRLGELKCELEKLQHL